jgi:hypothetical protein
VGRSRRRRTDLVVDGDAEGGLEKFAFVEWCERWIVCRRGGVLPVCTVQKIIGGYRKQPIHPDLIKTYLY